MLYNYIMKILILILLVLSTIGCKEDCVEEDKIIRYKEVNTYYYTTMEPELVCP